MAQLLLTKPVIHPVTWNRLFETSAQCQTLLSFGLPKTTEPPVNQAGFRMSQIFRVFYTYFFLSGHKQDFRCLMVVFYSIGACVHNLICLCVARQELPLLSKCKNRGMNNPITSHCWLAKTCKPQSIPPILSL